MTLAELLAVADPDEVWIPLNEDGTMLYNRETNSSGFASVTPAGRRRYRRLYRKLCLRVRARARRSAK